jgi:hypothetical protein
MRKISLRTDMALRPKFAVMNPELTFTLPPYQTASGIADMMAHIMERYFTTTDEVETTDRGRRCAQSHHHRSPEGDFRTGELQCPRQHNVGRHAGA